MLTIGDLERFVSVILRAQWITWVLPGFILLSLESKNIRGSLTYCWWKSSCISWCSKNPSIHRVLYMSGGAGCLPSTVVMVPSKNLNHLRLNGDTSIQFDKNTKYHIYTKEPQQKNTSSLHFRNSIQSIHVGLLWDADKVRSTSRCPQSTTQSWQPKSAFFYSRPPPPNCLVVTMRTRPFALAARSLLKFPLMLLHGWTTQPKRMNSSSLGSSP